MISSNDKNLRNALLRSGTLVSHDQPAKKKDTSVSQRDAIASRKHELNRKG